MSRWPNGWTVAMRPDARRFSAPPSQADSATQCTETRPPSLPIATRGLAMALSPRSGSAPSTRLIGRDAEQAELFAALTELRHGVGGVASIVGDSATGKTALLQWMIGRRHRA